MLHTFERDPLPFDDVRAALHARWAACTPEHRARLEGLLDRLDRLRTTWPTPLPGVSELHTGTSRVQIVAWIGDASETVTWLDEPLDHWCLDGFSPSANPAMWAESLLQAIGRRTLPRGTASTYTAAGRVRRGLIAAGFSVRKVPGHGRKRDMLAADKQEREPKLERAPLRHPWPDARPPGRVAVVGAGIAGCSIARELAEAGVVVDVFDADEPASGPAATRGRCFAAAQPGRQPVGDWTTRAFVWTRAWARRRACPGMTFGWRGTATSARMPIACVPSSRGGLPSKTRLPSRMHRRGPFWASPPRRWCRPPCGVASCWPMTASGCTPTAP